ncbi:hypothetical protein FRC17_010993 [Serendipita sp. 399]|nr:hypothetical protein FRC17_010993 [Serendipita sp. 399]
MSLLVKENTAIERRLTQTMLNLEVADASNRTLLHEIQEARGTITRLSAQNMKSVGWEAKLYSLQQERDDLREERKSEASRARTAEAKAAALSEKCAGITARLQADIYNLKEEKENARRSKADLSEEIIRDARLRLDALHVALSGMPKAEDAEMTRILEELVSENEALKHDNAELQNLLADCREDVRELREEVEEKRAAAPMTSDPRLEELNVFPSRSDRPTRHNKHESWTSTASAPVSVTSPRSEGFLSPRLPNKRVRTPSYSLQMGRRSVIQVRKSASDLGDEKTPEPLSGNETDPHRTLHSPAPSSRRTSISRHSYTPSTYSIEVDSGNQNDGDPASPPKGRKKLLLLTRSRGVQTDPITILPASPRPPSLLDEHTPSGTHSETSSMQEGKTSQFSFLLDKINALFHRIIQADIRTLTNRLKRQHLAGADVGHLSRTTISTILNEVSSLRNHFRGILEDERAAVVVSRKEFRVLLKTYSDLFQEIGSLRASVNEVVLNPSVGTKLREEALSPEDAQTKAVAKPAGGLGGWIAPISKLWAAPSTDPVEKPGNTGTAAAALARTGSSRNRLQPPKIAPKLAPAVSASTTTVNVEFTNAGIRRAISTTPGQSTSSITSQPISNSPLGPPRPQLKGIFAGTSGPSSVRPMASERAAQTFTSGGTLRGNPARRQGTIPISGESSNTVEDNFRRMSRVVDAMVDQNAVDDEEEDEFSSDLLQRTLRPRGLSDSSIHSSLIPHGPPVNRLLTPAGLALSPAVEQANARERAGTLNAGGGITSWLDRDAVLQSLSRKMQGFRFGTGSDLISPKPLPPADDGGLMVNTQVTPTGGTPTTSRSQLPASPPKPIPERLTSPNHIGRGDRSRSPPSRSQYSGSSSPRTPHHRRTGSLHRQAQI